MSVYVDPLRDHGDTALAKGLRHTHWCHMAADTHAELMGMARRLKLRPEWIQYAGTRLEHFDLTSNMRRRAVMAGAIELSHREFAERTTR